jgi:predicted transcriptional regulator
MRTRALLLIHKGFCLEHDQISNSEFGVTSNSGRQSTQNLGVAAGQTRHEGWLAWRARAEYEGDGRPMNGCRMDRMRLDLL